ncbi:hypothetical protein Tco_0265226 [Tanacetum coccineum]
METSKPLIKDENAEDVDVHLYRSMIGSLIYLTSSRPGIMFVVCACARFEVIPKISHLHVVKRIFRYLKAQPKLGIWYPKDSPFDLEAYTDSDYAGASLHRKSTTGGSQFLGSRLISWKFKRQTIVANSTTEVEFVAAASCCCSSTSSSTALSCPPVRNSNCSSSRVMWSLRVSAVPCYVAYTVVVVALNLPCLTWIGIPDSVLSSPITSYTYTSCIVTLSSIMSTLNILNQTLPS